MLRFVALSRVSSREQEREGFSLDIQDEALKIAAERLCRLSSCFRLSCCGILYFFEDGIQSHQEFSSTGNDRHIVCFSLGSETFVVFA